MSLIALGYPSSVGAELDASDVVFFAVLLALGIWLLREGFRRTDPAAVATPG